MPNGTMYSKAFKAKMVQLVREGVPRKELREQYGIATSTLANWVSQAAPGHIRGGEPTVAEIRGILAQHDAGETDITRLSSRRAETIQNWIEDPKFREATFEYDPSMTYDYYDLIDRSIVAHHLCTETDCVSDRIDILEALTAPTRKVPA
jgi:transposase-like protein